MNQIELLAKQAPFICQARNADAWAVQISAAWDAEQADKQSPFAREKHSGPWDRSKYWRIFEQDVPAEKRGTYSFILAILQIADQLHETGVADSQLVEMVKAVQHFYPEVTAIVSVDSLVADAVVQEVWN